MKIKIYSGEKLIVQIEYLLFCVMIFIKAYGDALLANDSLMGKVDDLKYVILFLVVLLGMIKIIKNGKINNQFVPDLKMFILWIMVWGLISVFTFSDITSSLSFSTRWWLYIILPFLYSFSVISTADVKTIDRYFKSALIICFGCYLLFEIGPNMFNIGNFALISFSNSYSPFESAYSAGSAMGLCAYFAYGDRKANRGWLIASMIFGFLTFKRLAIIMIVIYFVLPKIINKDRIIKKNWMVFRIVFVVLVTVVLAYFLHPDNYTMTKDFISKLTSLDLDKILMGRARLYSILVDSRYKTSGFSTSIYTMNQLIGKGNGIELELVQLLWEVTIAGVIVFVCFCYKLTNRNLYCVVIMDYMLFNMITSSSLGNPFGWIFVYLTIWSIRKQNSELNARISMKSNIQS